MISLRKVVLDCSCEVESMQHEHKTLRHMQLIQMEPIRYLRVLVVDYFSALFCGRANLGTVLVISELQNLIRGLEHIFIL